LLDDRIAARASDDIAEKQNPHRQPPFASTPVTSVAGVNSGSRAVPPDERRGKMARPRWPSERRSRVSLLQ
jgi:hypothetical protein